MASGSAPEESGGVWVVGGSPQTSEFRATFLVPRSTISARMQVDLPLPWVSGKSRLQRTPTLTCQTAAIKR